MAETTDPTNVHETLKKLKVPIEGLTHYEKNPRRGNLSLIMESLETHGMYKPVVVRTGTNEILAGNHTVMAAKELGWSHVAATFVDVDDDEAARIVLVDNRANDVAGYDEDELAELLQAVDANDRGLEGTGFGNEDLSDLLASLDESSTSESEELPADVDEAPSEPEEPLSKPGDVIVLGDHRVICGDSTDPDTYARLLEGEEATLMWTDPPYGVEYVGKTSEALRIQNDGQGDIDTLLANAFAVAADHLKPGAPFYVAHSDTRRITFQTTLEAAGYLVRQNLVWVKNTFALGRSDYQYRHEPILYGFTPGGEGRLGRGGERWYGDNSQSTVFEVDKPPANRDHPTMKPVELVQLMLQNSCPKRGVVLDPFAGSGSTLIAAHYHGAAGRMVELDPRYVDVICMRWQRLTGEMPMRDGEELDFLG